MLIATGASPKTARGWFEHGGRVAVIERAGKVLAYYAVRVKHHDEYDWLRIDLSPADIWTQVTWVAPEWCGRGLYPTVRSFALSEYANAGYNRLFAVIDVLNRNSIRASTKRGSVILGRMGFVRVLGFTVVCFGRSVRLGWWGLGRRLTLDCRNMNENVLGAVVRHDQA